MIASWIAKRMIMSAARKMGEDNLDMDALTAMLHNDAVYDTGSDLGVGETIRGKEAIKEWIARWGEEFPKRKVEMKNICFSSWPLSLKNVCIGEWTMTQTDKQGKTFKYDGASVYHFKNFKIVHGTEYISQLGLPKLSDLIEPLAEG